MSHLWLLPREDFFNQGGATDGVYGIVSPFQFITHHNDVSQHKMQSGAIFK